MLVQECHYIKSLKFPTVSYKSASISAAHCQPNATSMFTICSPIPPYPLPDYFPPVPISSHQCQTSAHHFPRIACIPLQFPVWLSAVHPFSILSCIAFQSSPVHGSPSFPIYLIPCIAFQSSLVHCSPSIPIPSSALRSLQSSPVQYPPGITWTSCGHHTDVTLLLQQCPFPVDFFIFTDLHDFCLWKGGQPGDG